MALNKSKFFFLILITALTIVAALLLLTQSLKFKSQKEEISVRLLWLHQAQFAGIYSAKNEGFYRDANLKVNIIPGGPGINPIRMVASGSENIGICLGPDIIMARIRDIPVRALAIIVKENPTCYFAKKESG
ncbi:MAG: ABC transporter substrate-binding protein, partial [Candidatus Hodarchaeota archaeon]